MDWFDTSLANQDAWQAIGRRPANYRPETAYGHITFDSGGSSNYVEALAEVGRQYEEIARLVRESGSERAYLSANDLVNLALLRAARSRTGRSPTEAWLMKDFLFWEPVRHRENEIIEEQPTYAHNDVLDFAKKAGLRTKFNL